MKYKLKYKSARAKAYHSFLFYLCFSAIAILPIIVIDLLFVIIFAIFAAEHLPITEQNIYDCAYFVLVIEIFISILIALKSNKRYVKIDSKGVLIHNSNTEHFGLGQRNRLNVIVPFERVVGCYIEIPVDCPDNYKYKNTTNSVQTKFILITEEKLALRKPKSLLYQAAGMIKNVYCWSLIISAL